MALFTWRWHSRVSWLASIGPEHWFQYNLMMRNGGEGWPPTMRCARGERRDEHLHASIIYQIQKLQASRGTDAAGYGSRKKRAGAGSAPASPNKRRKTQKILITWQKWRSGLWMEGLISIAACVPRIYIIIAHTFPAALMLLPVYICRAVGEEKSWEVPQTEV